MARIARRFRDAALAAGVTLAYGVSVAFSLAATREAGGLAALWPASGVLAAGLLLARRPWRAPMIGLCMAAHLMAAIASGQALERAALFTLISASQAAATAWAARRYCGVQARRLGLRSLALLLVAAILPPAIVASVTAAAASHLIFGTPFDPFLRHWFFSALLGMVLVLPSALLIARIGHYRDFRRSWLEWAASLGVLVAMTAVIALQDKAPLMFLLLPAVTLVSVRLGPPGAAAAAMAVAAITVPLAILGRGHNLLSPDLSLAPRLHLIQLFIAAALFTGVATATALSDQVRLRRLLSARDRAGGEARARALQAERFAGLD